MKLKACRQVLTNNFVKIIKVPLKKHSLKFYRTAKQWQLTEYNVDSKRFRGLADRVTFSCTSLLSHVTTRRPFLWFTHRVYDRRLSLISVSTAEFRAGRTDKMWQSGWFNPLKFIRNVVRWNWRSSLPTRQKLPSQPYSFVDVNHRPRKLNFLLTTCSTLAWERRGEGGASVGA